MKTLHKKIKVIPIVSPFLRELAHYLCAKFKDMLPDFSRVMLVFPSQRNKYYFRRYLLEVSHTCGIIPPAMRTVDELLNDLYEASGGSSGMCVDRIERNFILKQVIDELKVNFWQDLSFLQFIAVGDRLLGFFDELTKERVRIADIEQEVQAGHYPERYVADELPILRTIYETYRSRIKNTSYHDVLEKYETLAERQELRVLDRYAYIGIIGLVATTNLESQIVRKLLEQYPAELILHGSKKEIAGASSTSATYYLHHKLLKSLGIEHMDMIGELPSQATDAVKPVIHIKKTGTEYEQIFHISKVLQRLAKYEPHRCAIILTDENLVRPVTEMLSSAGLEFNVSMGFPFTQSVLYSFLVLLKSAIESRYHHTEFFALIKHPLIKNARVDEVPVKETVYRLQEFMIRERLNYFDPAREYGKEYETLCVLVKRCAEVVQRAGPLEEYIDGLIDLLNLILSCNADVLKQTIPGIKEFPERLHRLARLRFHGKDSGGLDILGLVLRALKDETYAMRGEPMKGIQVIGLLEARNLDFDCVIIPSMNETVFPRYSERDLFVNRQIREKVGLPYDKERENHYYYYFRQLLSGKKEVYISYVEEAKRDMRSRFIDMLCAEGHSVDDTKFLLASHSLDTPPRKVTKDRMIMRRLEKIVTEKGLSPTSLKDYRECPYRFYLKYMLNMREPDEIIEEAGPMEWGSAMHGALHNFYRSHYPRGFTEEQLGEAQKKLCDVFEASLKSLIAVKPRSVTFLDMDLYKKRLERFLEYELERFKQGFIIDSGLLEERLQGNVDINGHPVFIKGYLDRVDRLDGRLYVIDYKTTIPDKDTYAIGDTFVEFQLPLYAMILSHGDLSKVAGMAYYGISRKVQIKEIVEPQSVQSYLNEFREQVLIPTIADMLDPQVTFAMSDNTDVCIFCSYQDLCGVGNV
ncbi:MAG: exodeoxyribonuclease V subunit gamma [candidate division WOR-3 bacterium]|nr:MAG: exodeoxyribonuclease V subunit gamma [candidate division WOR-3 bacterium]